jgi:hypothetical protein
VPAQRQPWYRTLFRYTPTGLVSGYAHTALGV